MAPLRGCTGRLKMHLWTKTKQNKTTKSVFQGLFDTLFSQGKQTSSVCPLGTRPLQSATVPGLTGQTAATLGGEAATFRVAYYKTNRLGCVKQATVTHETTSKGQIIKLLHCLGLSKHVFFVTRVSACNFWSLKKYLLLNNYILRLSSDGETPN